MDQTAEDQEDRSIVRNFRIAAAVAAGAIVVGAIFYHLVEKLSWLNATYFCVITLTTVGYGDIVPTTDAGKVFTIFYVLTGIGIIGTFANLAVRRAIIRRRRH